MVVNVDEREREGTLRPSDANAAPEQKMGRVNVSRERFNPAISAHPRQRPARPRDDGESNAMFCPSLARRAIDVAPSSSASWSNALFANMVVVYSLRVFALP